MERPLPYHLTVRSSFRGYQRGDIITDPALIDDILSGEDATHTVRIVADPDSTVIVAPAADSVPPASVADAIAAGVAAAEAVLHSGQGV